MRRICGIVLMLVIGVAAAAPAPAPEARPLGGLEAEVLLLLRQNRPRLQEELKLSESQVKKIEELNAEWRQSLSSSRGLNREEMRNKLQERQNLAKVHREAIVKILSKRQIGRAEQIYLQRIGPLTALGKKQVAAALKITDEQKEKIELIRRNIPPKIGGVARGGGGRQALIQEFKERRKIQQEKTWNVLTPAQKAKWKQLIGEPFLLEPRPTEGKEQPSQRSDRPTQAK